MFEDPRDIRLVHIDDIFNSQKASLSTARGERRHSSKNALLNQVAEETSTDSAYTREERQWIGDHSLDEIRATAIAKGDPNRGMARKFLTRARINARNTMKGMQSGQHTKVDEEHFNPSNYIKNKGFASDRNRQRIHALLGDQFSDIESYEKIKLGANQEPMVLWMAQIDAEVQKSRSTIERKLGRKLQEPEWKKIAKTISGEAKDRYMQEVHAKGLANDKYERKVKVDPKTGKPIRVHRIDPVTKQPMRDENGHFIEDFVVEEPKPKRTLGRVQGDPFQTKSFRKGEYVDRVIARSVAKKHGMTEADFHSLKKGYIVGAEGPHQVYAVVEKGQGWKSIFDVEGKLEHHILTDAGQQEYHESVQKMQEFHDDANVLRAMRNDVYNTKKGQAVNFQNTYEAMKAGRHGKFADQLKLNQGSFQKHDAFEVVDRFTRDQMAHPYTVAPDIMLDEKSYLFKLGAHINRARESINQSYYRKDTRTYKRSSQADTLEAQAARTAEREASLTPFGKLSQRLHELKEYQDFSRQSYRELHEQTREAGAGMVEGAADDIRSEYDKDTEAQQKGQQKGQRMSRSADEARRSEDENEWRDRQKQTDEYHRSKSHIGEDGMIRRSEGGGAYTRPITPQEQLRRSADEMIQGKLTPEQAANAHAWELQLQSNPGQLLVRKGDLVPHEPIAGPDGQYVNDKGDIVTRRKHLIVADSNINLTMRPADRGVTDTKGRLLDAMQRIDEDRLNTDVSKLLPEHSNAPLEFRIAGKLRTEMNEYANQEGAGQYLFNQDGHVVMHREKLKDALVGQLYRKNGVVHLPQWMNETVHDRALWMLNKETRQDLPAFFATALDDVIKTGFDFETLEQDKHFQERLSRLGHIEDPLLRRYIAATNRDVLYGMMRQFFDTGKGGESVDHMVTSVIHEYQRRNETNQMPSLSQMEEMVAGIDQDMQAHGFDNLKDARKHLQLNWKQIQEKAMEKPPISLDAFDRPDGAYAGPDEEDLRGGLEYDQGVIKDDDIALTNEKKLSDAMREQAEVQAQKKSRIYYSIQDQFKKITGDEGEVEAAQLLEKLRDTLPAEIDGKANKARNPEELVKFYLHNEKSDILATVMAGGNVEMNLNDASHAKQLAEFTRYGFQLEGTARINGKQRSGRLELGKNGEVIFRDNRNMPHLLADHINDAADTFSARGGFDTDRIRTMPIEDYRPLPAPDGHIPVVMNQPNVREASRLGKSSYVPQTMAETLMHMEAVRKGNRMVAMDVETTLLPTGTASKQHMLEASLRSFKWTDGGLVQDKEERLLLKPDAGMRAQVAEIQGSIGKQVADTLTKYTNPGEQAQAISSLEDLSYLRNIAKFAGTETAQASSSFKMPSNMTEYLATLQSDVNTAMAMLEQKGTHTMPQMMDRINKFVNKSIVLAQNGANAEKVWMDMLRERNNITPEQFIQQRLKGVTVNSDMESWIKGLPHAARQVEEGAVSMENLRKRVAPEMSSALEEYIHIRDGKHLIKEFRPKMIELIHASRNFADEPGLSHNMLVQVERAYADERISKEMHDAYKSNAHFAEADTQATAEVFEGYMRKFEQNGGYKPEFIAEGTKVAKVRDTGDQVNKGIYTVGKWDKANNTLQLIDDQGREVSHAVAGTSELNALFQSNFIVAPKGVDQEGFLQEAQAALNFDTARQDIQEANSYTKFMNNRIKYMAAHAGHVDDRGYAVNNSVEIARGMGYETKASELINVTENEKQAAEHGHRYWSSAEADLKQKAFGQLQDMMDLGHISQNHADEMMKEIQTGFDAMGDRGTQRLQGYIDAGHLLKQYGGGRVLLAARSENDLYQSLWNMTGDLTKHIKDDEPMTEDTKRNRAIREILIPHLDEQKMYPRYTPGTGRLQPEERLRAIARTLYNNSRQDGNVPYANAPGIEPTVTDVNRADGEAMIQGIFQKGTKRMGGATQRAFDEAQRFRSAIESDGGMLPQDVQLARLSPNEQPTMSLQNRYQKKFQGMTVGQIAEHLKKEPNGKPGDMQHEALRELNSIFNANGSEAEEAAIALGRTQGTGPFPKEATARERYGDVREAMMPIGPHKGAKMRELPESYVLNLMHKNEPLYDSQKQLVTEYMDHLDAHDLAFDNPRTEEDMNNMYRSDREIQRSGLSPADVLGRPVRNAVGDQATRDTMEETASDMAFKDAVDHVPRNPDEIVQRGRALQLLEDGAESISKTFGKIRKGGGKALGIAGLVAGGALVMGNLLSDPSSWKRPNGDSPNVDGDHLDAPPVDMGQPVARVEDHGSGLDGMRVRVRGKAPGHLDNNAIGSMVGDGIRSSIPHETNVKVNSRDDTTSINHQWLKQTYTDFMKNGYANG